MSSPTSTHHSTNRSPTGAGDAAAGDPAPPGSIVLRLHGVSKRFGAVAALTDIDLDVAAGEVVAIVGDNGAGKSTLVKVLSGVHRPDGGQIVFHDQPVQIPDPAAAITLGIATVFQDLALCENLDVVANLFLGHELAPLHLNEVDMEVRAWQLLGELSARIPSVRTPVASLSGGQRQTVAIARSLLGDPKIIILDEPTAALGVAQTAEVLDLIERLRERGLGVIMISHNMDDVRAVADRVVVLRLGRNNGVFDIDTVSQDQIVSAITGGTDNAVSRRTARRSTRPHPTDNEPHPAAPDPTVPSGAADPATTAPQAVPHTQAPGTQAPGTPAPGAQGPDRAADSSQEGADHD